MFPLHYMRRRMPGIEPGSPLPNDNGNLSDHASPTEIIKKSEYICLPGFRVPGLKKLMVQF